MGTRNRLVCPRAKNLGLLAVGSGVSTLDVGTATRIDRELETFALELATEGNRLHGGGALVQDIDLFKG